MKIGFVSDIHCNVFALEAALDALADADRIYCLGDAISEHRFSNGVVGLLRARDIPTIQGNHEAMFFSEHGVRARQADWIDPELVAWLESCPHEMELDVASKRLLLVHATPWPSGWAYVFAGSTEFERFGDRGADFIAYGHTHQPVVRRSGRTLVINPGSVGEGRPTPHGFQLSCAVLDVETEEATVIDIAGQPVTD